MHGRVHHEWPLAPDKPIRLTTSLYGRKWKCHLREWYIDRETKKLECGKGVTIPPSEIRATALALLAIADEFERMNVPMEGC